MANHAAFPAVSSHAGHAESAAPATLVVRGDDRRFSPALLVLLEGAIIYMEESYFTAANRIAAAAGPDRDVIVLDGCKDDDPHNLVRRAYLPEQLEELIERDMVEFAFLGSALEINRARSWRRPPWRRGVSGSRGTRTGRDRPTARIGRTHRPR